MPFDATPQGGGDGGRGLRHDVVSDPDRAYAYICEQYYIGRTEDMKGICQLRDGEVIAAVMFDSFTSHNCFMHIASDGTKKWMTRQFLHTVFRYPFVTLGLARITAWIEINNFQSRAIARGTGFREEAVLESAGRDGVDVLIYRMFRQECRYA